MINIIDDFRISLLLYQVNILVTIMHIIMFARVLLQAIGMMQRLNLPLGFLGTLPEEKDDEKDKQRNGILTPFFELYVLPKLRKIHSFTKILRKVTKKLAYMQIFY